MHWYQAHIWANRHLQGAHMLSLWIDTRQTCQYPLFKPGWHLVLKLGWHLSCTKAKVLGLNIYTRLKFKHRSLSSGGDPHSIRLTGLVCSLLGVLGVGRIVTGHEQPGLAVLPPLPPPVVRGRPPLPGGPLRLLRLVPPVLPRAGPCDRLLRVLLIAVQTEAVALARSGGCREGGSGHSLLSNTPHKYPLYPNFNKSWRRVMTYTDVIQMMAHYIRQTLNLVLFKQTYRLHLVLICTILIVLICRCVAHHSFCQLCICTKASPEQPLVAWRALVQVQQKCATRTAILALHFL